MLSLLALIALTPAAYSFPIGVAQNYAMTVGFDGYIPLMGGRNAKVDVSMGLTVTGAEPDAKGRPRAVSDLTSVKILFNGTPMPFDLGNVRAYFPKTTVSLSPGGRVLETDAPDVQLPARLPGLDAKRFPEVTYLPIELPEGGLEEGKPWTFTRTLAGSPAKYTAIPTKITDAQIEISVAVEQVGEAYEDANRNPLSDAKDARVKVVTTLTGKGSATFDRKLGVVSLFVGETDATSVATDVKTGKASSRKLKTSIRVELVKPKS